MRWFASEWQSGGLDGAEAARCESDYAAYIASIAGQRPERVLVLALPRHRQLSLDDAKLNAFETDAARRRIRLRVLNGDLQADYGKFQIECECAGHMAPPVAELRAVFTDERTEFLRQEIELVSEGPAFELRFLLWPRGELAIQCEDLQATWSGILDTTCSDRRNEVIVAKASEWSTGH